MKRMNFIKHFSFISASFFLIHPKDVACFSLSKKNYLPSFKLEISQGDKSVTKRNFENYCYLNDSENDGLDDDSGHVKGRKVFVANGIDGEFDDAKTACIMFGRSKFPSYDFVTCTTSFNGSVWYQFKKGKEKFDQQGQVWFKLVCPESALQYSTDGTDNWQKQECQCHSGYKAVGDSCVKDTILTCLGKLLKKYDEHKEILLRLYKECILWDSVCVLLEKDKVDVEKFLLASSKKTSKQDSNALIWKNISSIDTGIVLSWQIVYKATEDKANSDLRSDFPLVFEVRQVKHNGAFIEIGGDIGIQKLIKANKRANCKSCDISGYPNLSSIDEFISDANYFILVYKNNKVLETAKQINSSGSYNKTVEGTAFQFRILHNYQNAITGMDIQFEGSIDDEDSEGDNEDRSLCKYDMRSGIPDFYHYYEFKSLKYSSHFNAKQLLTYLENIETPDQLTYIFDGRKMTQIQAIKMLRKTIIDNFDTWYTQLGHEKWIQLVGMGSNKEEILVAVNNLENNFYYRVVKVFG